MAQYRTGTVSINNGSVFVSGAGTLWASAPGLAAGQLFNIQGTDGWYYIASIVSNTSLRLTSAYAGVTVSSENYAIVRDYLTPQDIPLMHRGDVNWPSIYNEAMLKIQTSLGGGGGAVTGLGLDAAYNYGNEITVDTDAVILNRVGTVGGTDKAPALRIMDQNLSGVSGWSPLSGALNYTYSKHRIPIVGVTNYAERGDSGSTSNFASTAILGVANADEADEFVNYPWLRNVGVAGYAIDYHNNYSVNKKSNVGVYGYSQSGYGISAKSDSTFAAYVEQDGQPGMKVLAPNAIGHEVDAERPLVISSTGYAGAMTQFAVSVAARRGGMQVTATNTQTRDYPGIRVSSAGVAARFEGKTFAENAQTALFVSGGALGYPAASINSNRMGLSVQGTAEVAVDAQSTTHPAIRSQDGVIARTDDHTAISNPEKGTVVWSKAASGLVTYDGASWSALSYGGGGPIGGGSTLHEAYVAGRTISILTGGTFPVLINSIENTALSVQTTSLTPYDAAQFYSARGFGIDVQSNATSVGYGAIRGVVSGAGAIINARTYGAGPFGIYQGDGVVAGYAFDMDVGTGGGIRITQTGESVAAYGPISVGSDLATLITANTDTGKLLDFAASTGTTQGDGYAATLDCAAGAGMRLIGTGSTGNMLRIENNNAAATVVHISSGLGTALDVYGAGTGMNIRSTGGYAIEATRTDGPAVKSSLGIVASAVSPYAVPNPESGTILYSSSDAMCYYYTDAVNGWMPIAIPSGYVPPTGAPSCYCINGVVIYSSDISAISSPEEGTIVYNAPEQLIYYRTRTAWSTIAGGASGIGAIGGSNRGNNILIKGNLSGAPYTNVASFIMPIQGYITKCRAAVDTPPLGTDILLDVNRNDVSVLGLNRLTIPAGSYESDTRLLGGESVNQYDTISIDIDQMGSTQPGGQDLRVIVYFDGVDIEAVQGCGAGYCPKSIPTISSYVQAVRVHVPPWWSLVAGFIYGSDFGVYCGSAAVYMADRSTIATSGLYNLQEVVYWTNTQIQFAANNNGFAHGTSSRYDYWIILVDGCGNEVMVDYVSGPGGLRP